jgi:5-methylcytosine-specific restriction endonuclease McrA
MSDFYAQMCYNLATSNSDGAGVISTSRRLSTSGKGKFPMASDDSTTPLKHCSKCNQDYPATLEYFNRHRTYGLQAWCKQCQRASANAWNAANPDKHNANRARWEAENREKRTRQRNELRQAKVEHERQVKRDYYANNSEKIKARVRRYQRANLDKVHIRGLRWRTANLDRAREKCRQWYASNHEKALANNRNRRARIRASEGTHTTADIKTQLERQKRCCYWCGCKLEKYHVDHVIPLVRGGRNDPSNLVIACPQCNLSKGDKLPHEWEGSNGRLL